MPKRITDYFYQQISKGLSRKDAVKQTAKELDLPKNVVYDIALKENE